MKPSAPPRAGGWHDHVHILCGFARTITVAQLVESLKTETSKWIKKREPTLSTFHWQNGYGAFSIGQSQVSALVEYIDQQPRHHADVSFQDEFRALCAKYQLVIDERYVWD